jgi:hypothetical protein
MRRLCFATLFLTVCSTCLSAQTDTGSALALHKYAALSGYGKLPHSTRRISGGAEPTSASVSQWMPPECLRYGFCGFI